MPNFIEKVKNHVHIEKDLEKYKIEIRKYKNNKYNKTQINEEQEITKENIKHNKEPIKKTFKNFYELGKEIDIKIPIDEINEISLNNTIKSKKEASSEKEKFKKIEISNKSLENKKKNYTEKIHNNYNLEKLSEKLISKSEQIKFINQINTQREKPKLNVNAHSYIPKIYIQNNPILNANNQEKLNLFNNYNYFPKYNLSNMTYPTEIEKLKNKTLSQSMNLKFPIDTSNTKTNDNQNFLGMTYNNINAKGQQNKLSMKQKKEINKIDIQKILKNEETRTTIMIQNIPPKYSSFDFSRLIDKEFSIESGKGNRFYNFIYVPLSKKIGKNLGYGFINMIHPKYIIPFIQKFEGEKLKMQGCKKPLSIIFADEQGKEKFLDQVDICRRPIEFKDCIDIKDEKGDI